jgi:hypothetical protein
VAYIAAVNLQASFRAFASESVSPGSLLGKLNEVISNNIASDKFVRTLRCDVSADLRSYNEGAANEQRTYEGRVKQRALQKGVPKQGENVEGDLSPTVARPRIYRGFPRQAYRQIEDEASREN